MLVVTTTVGLKQGLVVVIEEVEKLNWHVHDQLGSLQHHESLAMSFALPQTYA